jgi:hypothetical protein
MALWEISFRAQYDYPFISMSGRHPGIPISMWCIWGKELLQVPSQDERELGEIEKEIRKAGRVVDKWIEAQESRIFMLRCTCGTYEQSPWNVWESYEFFDAPPAVYQDGWGYFRVVGFEESGTRGLFRDFNRLGPTELIRKRELSLNMLPSSVWVNSLFADLTSKQADAVLKAHRYGYYNSPRQITTESIAKSLGISRSTYEEHLRKAENQIINALIPYLQLFASAEKKPAVASSGTKVLPAPTAEA